MNKEDNEKRLAKLLYIQTRLKSNANESSVPPFEGQATEVQHLYILKAREYIRQVEAGMEFARDEDHLRDIITKTVAKLGNEKMVGNSEISFMTEVAMECNKILPSAFIKQHLDAEKLMFMYYAGLSVEQAAKMFCNFMTNMQDKLTALKAVKPKGNSSNG